MRVGALVLAVLMVPGLVLARSAPATATDAYPVCTGLKPGGLGAPRIDLTLSAVNYGPFVHLVGEARFSQAVAPPVFEAEPRRIVHRHPHPDAGVEGLSMRGGAR